MLLTNLKHTIRKLRRSPGFALLNLAGFALGIACSFSGIQYARQELSYDKGFANSSRIYRVGTDFMGMGGFANGPEALAGYMLENAPEVEAAARVRHLGELSLADGARSISVKAMQTDSAFFRIFEYGFAEGSPVQALTAPGQAVISESLARRWFGEGPALGRTIRAGEEQAAYTVSGVARDSRRKSHIEAELWLSIYPELTGERSWYTARYYNYFLLKTGATRAAFEASLEALVRKNIYPDFQNSGQRFEEWAGGPQAYRFIVQPLGEIHLKSSLNFELGAGGNEAKVWGFLIIGVFVLLIALANYINLTTARPARQAREIGIKKAVGAGRGSLIGQLLTEAVVFGLLSGFLALGLTELLQILFREITGEALLQESLLRLDTLALFCAFCLAASLLAGAYPALFLTAFHPVRVLKGEYGPGGGNPRLAQRMRAGLVVLQFAIAGLLMIGSLAVWRQLGYMSEKDLGFDRKGVFIIKNARELGEHAKAFQAELDKLPQVRHSSFSQSVPAGEDIVQTTFKTPQMKESLPLRTFPADAGFLETLGIKLIAGSNFPERQSPDTSVALVTEAAARALGLDSPVGAEIRTGKRVVGVVSDFHIESLRNGIQPIVFTHAVSGNYLSLSLSAGAGKSGADDFIRRAEALWKSFVPGASMHYEFLDESFARLSRQDAVQGKGILGLTLLSVFIACLGLFGLAAFAAEQRAKEIGIRKVLGASAANIVGLLSKDFLKLVLIALAIASPLGWHFARQWLQGFAYRVDVEWWVFALAGLLATGVAFLTVGFQSLKAALANPVESLKAE